MKKEKEIYEAIVRAKDTACPGGYVAFWDGGSLVRWLNTPRKYTDKAARLAVLLAGDIGGCDGWRTAHFCLPSTKGAIGAFPYAKQLIRNHRDIWLDGFTSDGKEVEIALRYEGFWADTCPEEFVYKEVA